MHDAASPGGGVRDAITHSEDETRALAAEVARALPDGAVVHLRGPLGAGKTHFVKGLAEGLGLEADDVVSPTFTLVHVHAARGGRGLVHVDLYRLGDEGELEELGLSELPGPNAIAAIEWPDRLPEAVQAGAVRVDIEDRGEDERRLTIRWPDPAAAPLGSILG